MSHVLGVSLAISADAYIKEYLNSTAMLKANTFWDVLKSLNSIMWTIVVLYHKMLKSRKENPQKLTQLSSRSHPRHLVGKRTAQKDINIDTTSDSQVNSNFPNRWSPASLTFNNYFYLFLCLYIT